MNDLFDKLNLEPKERRLAVLFFAVFFLFVNYMYVFPNFNELEQTKNKITKTQNKLKLYQLKTNQIPDLEFKIMELGEQAGPSIQDSPGQRSKFSRTVNQMATQKGVTIRRQSMIREIQPNTGQTNKFFTELEIPVNIEGTEEQVVNFLHALSEDDSLIRVRSLTLNPSRSGGLLLDGNLNLVASFLKSEQKEKKSGNASRGGQSNK